MNARTRYSGSLKNTLSGADDRAKYDAVCKCILKERAVLARILKETVAEYAYCSIEDIADKYIEPDSISSDTPVARNLTNINGLSEEDSTTNEGVVKFDVKFLAKSPSSNGRSLINLYIDVEAQKNYHINYPIEKRAAYYCARMLSSQIGNITENMNYDILNKVFSIWICFDVPNYAANTVSRYHYTKEDLLGTFSKIKESDYGLMETIIIRLAKDDTRIGNDLIDLLHGLFGGMEYSKKLERLNELGLDVSLVRKEMDQMCNLSERILERGIEQGLERGTELAKRELALKMYKKGTPIRQISDLTDIDIHQLEEWITEK